MNTETMYVNPNELVIDMPVDEANVEWLTQSLQVDGLIDPVIVWLQGLRIIDGFHRAVAAQRLGWDSVLCRVVDCDEDRFWDIRIQSARRHHKIEGSRLAQWMYESWKQTEWYEPDENVPQKSLFKRVLEILILKQSGWTDKPDETHLNDTEKEILAWFMDKAAKWGIGTIEIAYQLNSVIEKKMTWDSLNTIFMDQIKRHNLSYDEAVMAFRKTGNGYITQDSKDWFVDWLSAEFLPKKAKAKDFDEWSQERAKQIRLTELENERKEVEKRQRQIGQERQQENELHSLRLGLENERRRQWEQTPQGQAAIEKQRAEARLRTLTDSIAYARRSLESTSHVIDNVPEAPALLAEFAQFVVEFAKLDDAKVNTVALENAKLREENKQLKERIESLERALAAKQSITPKLGDVVALSSVELSD